MDVSTHEPYSGRSDIPEPEVDVPVPTDQPAAQPARTTVPEPAGENDVGVVGWSRGWLESRLRAAGRGRRGVPGEESTERTSGLTNVKSGGLAESPIADGGATGVASEDAENVRHWRPTSRWECVECYTTNDAGVTFCQQCGRLASSIEQVLLADEEFFVIDGLKALRAGDEETAHRCFVLATEHNRTSEVGWYWRARTGETIDEVIACLEELRRLSPDDQQARADLELARERKGREQLVASITDMSVSASAQVAAPNRSSKASGGLSAIRHVLFELASIPCFALGLMFAGNVIVEALRIVGVRGEETLLPQFTLPSVLVTLPGALAQPESPRFNVLSIVPVLVSLWYFRLAFRLGDGAPNSRALAVVSGIAAVGAASLVVLNDRFFVAAAVALCFCALLGERRSTDDAVPM